MIRKANLSDAEQIAHIKVDGWKTAYKGIIADSLLNGMEYRLEELRVQGYTTGKNKGLTGSIVVYENEGKVKGFTYYGEETSDFPRNCGEVFALYVNFAYYRQGIRKSLKEWVKNELVNQGFTYMIIWCLKDKLPSIAFYIAMGGTVVTERDIEIGGILYKEVGMSYRL